MLQVSRPETSLKRDSGTGIFLWIFCNSSKSLIHRTPPDDCFCWFLHSNQNFYLLITLCSFFPSLFSFIIDNCNYRSLLRKCLKMKIFLLFTNIYSKINMLLRKFCLGNNLPTHIQENIDFLRQKSWQLQNT